MSKLHFSVDINAYTLAKLIQKNGQAIFYYLELTDSSSHFFSCLAIIEGRRATHSERINNNRTPAVLRRGDNVMTRIAIQSYKKKETVAKLCFVIRGS